jgi:hypothetical protein
LRDSLGGLCPPPDRREQVTGGLPGEDGERGLTESAWPWQTIGMVELSNMMQHAQDKSGKEILDIFMVPLMLGKGGAMNPSENRRWNC